MCTNCNPYDLKTINKMLKPDLYVNHRIRYLLKYKKKCKHPKCNHNHNHLLYELRDLHIYLNPKV